MADATHPLVSASLPLELPNPPHTMNESTVIPLDALANAYAASWSAQRPAPETVRPANRAELRGALEANEVFLSHMEILPEYSRCGINE